MAHHNWSEIYQYYISNEGVSYQDCSDKFDIPVGTIKERGSLEKWNQKRITIFRTATQLMETRLLDAIIKRNEEHAKIGRALQGVALETLATSEYKPKSYDEIRKGLETGIKIERQALSMDKKIPSAVEIANNQGQRLRITWGDNEPVGEFLQTENNLELVKSYDSY